MRKSGKIASVVLAIALVGFTAGSAVAEETAQDDVGQTDVVISEEPVSSEPPAQDASESNEQSTSSAAKSEATQPQVGPPAQAPFGLATGEGVLAPKAVVAAAGPTPCSVSVTTRDVTKTSFMADVVAVGDTIQKFGFDIRDSEFGALPDLTQSWTPSDGLSLEATVSGLKPKTGYYVQAWCFTWDGFSAQELPFDVLTGGGEPAEPTPDDVAPWPAKCNPPSARVAVNAGVVGSTQYVRVLTCQSVRVVFESSTGGGTTVEHALPAAQLQFEAPFETDGVYRVCTYTPSGKNGKLEWGKGVCGDLFPQTPTSTPTPSPSPSTTPGDQPGDDGATDGAGPVTTANTSSPTATAAGVATTTPAASLASTGTGGIAPALVLAIGALAAGVTALIVRQRRATAS